MRVIAIIFGAILLIVAVRGTTTQTADGSPGLWPLLKNDFEPGQKGNFLAWAAAILIIGMLGYIPQIKPIANSMLALLIVVLLLSGHGFFSELQKAIQQPAGKAA